MLKQAFIGALAKGVGRVGINAAKGLFGAGPTARAGVLGTAANMGAKGYALASPFIGSVGPSATAAQGAGPGVNVGPFNMRTAAAKEAGFFDALKHFGAKLDYYATPPTHDQFDPKHLNEILYHMHHVDPDDPDDIEYVQHLMHYHRTPWTPPAPPEKPTIAAELQKKAYSIGDAIHDGSYLSFIAGHHLHDKYPRLATGLEVGGLVGLGGSSMHDMAKNPSERVPSGMDLAGLALMGGAMLKRHGAHGAPPPTNSVQG